MGLLAYHVVLLVSGQTVISQRTLLQQETRLTELQTEQRELTEDLFKSHVLPDSEPAAYGLPYNEFEDAEATVAAARVKAVEDERFLMVTFGANWCMDCRTLHRNLHNDEVEKYTNQLFSFVNVDVGKFNQNKQLAIELGVSLSKGIPVAIFFDPDGNMIGTTNEGQLEPARHYSSKQILKFVRDVAERSRILAPDSVQ